MERSGDMACEYCFGNLYIWAPVYENTICEYDGMFLARDGVGDPMYLYPCGDGGRRKRTYTLCRKSRRCAFNHVLPHSVKCP